MAGLSGAWSTPRCVRGRPLWDGGRPMPSGQGDPPPWWGPGNQIERT